MSKKKKQNKINYPQASKTNYKNLLKWVGGLGTILGLVLGVPSLFPKVNVNPEQMLDPKEPFSAQLVISNDGSFDIHTLTFVCRQRRVLYERGGRLLGNVLYTNSIPILKAGESTTCKIPSFVKFRTSIISADVDCILKFQPEYWFSQEKTFRFVTEKRKDGNFAWFPRAESAP